jgi:hypothetical protein
MKEGASFGEYGLELEYDGMIARIVSACKIVTTGYGTQVGIEY